MQDLSEEQKEKIRKFWDVDTLGYCSFVEKSLSVRLSPLNLLLALSESTKSELPEFACLEWSNEKILESIKNTKIVLSLPKIEEEIILFESIIPSDVIRDLNEETIKFKGEKWIVHKNDADPFPSNPHAHNYEAGLKLHLGNGELYSGTKLVGKISDKDFEKIKKLFKNTNLPS